jgi:hypothetical protein
MMGFDLLRYLQRQIDFSLATFGPGHRTAGVIDHIRKELVEIEAAPLDLEEWIDVAMLALDGAWRTGATPEQIVTQLVMKLEKNKRRTWPDWRTVPAGKAIEHVRAPVLLQDFYVHRAPASNLVFVKTAPFFESQGGLTDEWGKHWTKIRAKSIEDARRIGPEGDTPALPDSEGGEAD